MLIKYKKIQIYPDRLRNQIFQRMNKHNLKRKSAEEKKITDFFATCKKTKKKAPSNGQNSKWTVNLTHKQWHGFSMLPFVVVVVFVVSRCISGHFWYRHHSTDTCLMPVNNKQKCMPCEYLHKSSSKRELMFKYGIFRISVCVFFFHIVCHLFLAFECSCDR